MMTDEQITSHLGLIISEMAQRREARSAYLREFLDKKRRLIAQVGTGNPKYFTNAEVKVLIAENPKPNVAEKEAMMEMEIGEIAFKDAVICEELKMLSKESDTISTYTMHTASLRKAEKL